MKKLLTIVLIASFAFVGAFGANAVTIEELQAQIATLLQQIAALQGTTTPTTPTTATCFTTDLQLGMTSSDVTSLQTVLAKDPAIYPEGLTTGYFGPMTLAAVKKFQAANNIITTGYVGPLTRGALNAKYCVTTPVTTPTTPVTTPTTPVDATEGSLTAIVAPTFVETTLKKGDTQKAILATRVEAKNSDITLKRVDVKISDATTVIQPWRSFSTFELYADGSLVKGVPALKDNFIETEYGKNYTLRFDGLSIPVAKDQKVDLVLKVSVPTNPENITGDYNFQFVANSIRGVDTLGIDQYAPTGALTASAEFASSGWTASTGTLTHSLNVNSPKTGYIIGNATAVTSNVVLGMIDIKSENQDSTIKTLAATMTDANVIASALKLYDGSTLVASIAGANGAVTFSNLSILIAKDTTKTLTLKADLKPITGALIGKSISASIAHTDITAIDAIDNAATVTAGTVATKTQTAYSKAPTFAFGSANIVKTTQAGSADVADATVVMNVTANNGDIYINKTKEVLPAGTAIVSAADAGGGTSVTFTTSSAHGINNGETITLYGTNTYDGTYTVTGVGSATTFTVTATWAATTAGKVSRWASTYTTTADSYDATYYVVRSGETKSFTLTGRLVGGNAFAEMSLGSFEWSVNSDGSSPVITTPTTYDLSTFKTTSIYLSN